MIDKEKVKALLDEVCYKRDSKCITAYIAVRDTSRKVCMCWTCHENDALAARIAELEGKT